MHESPCCRCSVIGQNKPFQTKNKTKFEPKTKIKLLFFSSCTWYNLPIQFVDLLSLSTMILKVKELMLPNYKISCLSFSHQVTEHQCDGVLFNWILFSASVLTVLYHLCLLHFSESPGKQSFVNSQRAQVHLSLFPRWGTTPSCSWWLHTKDLQTSCLFFFFFFGAVVGWVGGCLHYPAGTSAVAKKIKG